MSHPNDETISMKLTLTGEDGTTVTFETKLPPGGNHDHPAGIAMLAVCRAHETVQMMREKKAAEKAAQPG